jgi:tetratricopeptide (TPR) repeat protein
LSNGGHRANENTYRVNGVAINDYSNSRRHAGRQQWDHPDVSRGSGAHAYAISGNQAEARKLLTQLVTQSRKQYVSPYYIAIVYLALGKNETAMDWLERAFTDRSNGLVFLKVESELDPLRSNLRFIALEHKLNFPN